MAFDFDQFDEEIARYDAIHARHGGQGTAMGAKELSAKMAHAIETLLPEVNTAMPEEQIDKLAYLCAKASEFCLYPSRRMLEARFHYHIGNFEIALTVFEDVLSISQHPAEYKQWPHLPADDANLSLITWLAYTHHQLGDAQQADQFVTLVKQWKQQDAVEFQPG